MLSIAVLCAGASITKVLLVFQHMGVLAYHEITITHYEGKVFDKPQIPLSVEIPYYLLKKWHRKKDASNLKLMLSTMSLFDPLSLSPN